VILPLCAIAACGLSLTALHHDRWWFLAPLLMGAALSYSHAIVAKRAGGRAPPGTLAIEVVAAFACFVGSLCLTLAS
jgi:hypothetical protein